MVRGVMVRPVFPSEILLVAPRRCLPSIATRPVRRIRAGGEIEARGVAESEHGAIRWFGTERGRNPL